MDSLSQIALGSAVSIAAIGGRSSPWKAALVGAVCGTLPDLDVFINHGDPIRNMTMHRAESHALFYLTVISPVLAWLVTKWTRERPLFYRWWLAVWLALITHPLLDFMTVYGTQLGLPFTNYPYGVGSIFIIDPLYTIPLLVGTTIALILRNVRGLRWNTIGLTLSTLYLGWSVLAQQYVRHIAKESLKDEGVQTQQILVTPTPLNTVVWRVLVIRGQEYGEGFYSLLDKQPHITFQWLPRSITLYEQWHDDENVKRIAQFSHGFFAMSERHGEVRISDLRMGQEPYYTFTFAVGEQRDGIRRGISPRIVSERPDVSEALRWLWQRAQGKTVLDRS